MVGPGEVDDDLEPEVKEECNGKYGDVNKVVIFEMPNVSPEEAVRIFIEFKRVESAIKGEDPLPSYSSPVIRIFPSFPSLQLSLTSMVGSLAGVKFRQDSTTKTNFQT